MEFLYPSFLYALAALAIPVIIHLFNFRRFKKIPFTNVRFLRDIKQKTQSQNKLKHLLVLLMRLLAITFLVLAFAQPFMPHPDEDREGGRRTVSIFVDNSFSMEGESAAGTMLEVARNRAIDMAMAFDNTDRFHLLTHDFEGKHQRYVSRDVFVDWVQDIELSPRSRSVIDIAARQDDMLKQGAGPSRAFIISDFQKSRFDFEQFQPDTAYPLSLVHLERNDVANLYIDSVWFESPVRRINEPERLNVRVANSGNRRQEGVPVRLEINGRQATLASVDVDEHSRAIATLEYVNEQPGLHQAAVSVQDSPVSYDDTYYFSYDVYDKIDILAIRHDESNRDALARMFAGDSVYLYRSVNARNVDYANLTQNSLVILSELDEIPSGLAGELTTFVKNGGTLWVIPSASANVAQYNSLFTSLNAPGMAPKRRSEQKVRAINTEHPLYKGVFERMPKNPDLPEVKAYYPVNAGGGGDQLMTLSGGDAMLAVFRPGRGQLFVQATSLDEEESNIRRHGIFVATALRIAELSQATSIRAIWIADDAYFSIPAVGQVLNQNLHLVNEDTSTDLIPIYQMREGRYFITPGPEVTEAGNYTLRYGDEILSGVGLNYPRTESDLTSYTRAELESALALSGNERVTIFDGADDGLGRKVAEAARGTALWKICLFLALLSLLAEVLLLRFWKTSTP